MSFVNSYACGGSVYIRGIPISEDGSRKKEIEIGRRPSKKGAADSVIAGAIAGSACSGTLMGGALFGGRGLYIWA